jgi:hypothetical protein
MSRLSPGLANEAINAEERIVAITAATVLDPAKHANRTLLVTANTGALALTLPAAKGSGDFYRIHLNTAVSGGITVVAGVFAGVSNKFVGRLVQRTSASTVVVYSSTTNDLITLDGTTQGGATSGDFIVLQDTAIGQWSIVDSFLNSSGNAATPFSG